jgi:cyanophycinase
MGASKETRKSPTPKTTEKKPAARSLTKSDAKAPRGTLFIVGGAEDKQETRAILRALAQRLDGRKLLIATLASEFPEERWREYHQIFRSLGVRQSEHLNLERRTGHADEPTKVVLQREVGGIFFTGGDQLRITTKLGGTRFSEEIDQLFQRGGIIAGTSAGASALGEMMIVGTKHQEVYHMGDPFQMSPGLGLLKNVIIDQHFSERGRIRRLLAAVAQNPRLLGIGIDEDTAIMVSGAESFEVIGSGAVYLVDARGLSYTNISEASLGETMSVFGIQLHVLSHGDQFDLRTHLPIRKPEAEPLVDLEE